MVDIPTLSLAQRRKLIELIRELTSSEAKTKDDVVAIAFFLGYSERNVINTMNTLFHFKRLERVQIRPSDGFSDAKYGYKWVVGANE